MRQNNNGRKRWNESENERQREEKCTSCSNKGIVQDKVDNPDSEIEIHYKSVEWNNRFQMHFKQGEDDYCDPHLVHNETDKSLFCSSLQLQASDTFSKYLYFAKISSGAQIPKNTFPSCSILCLTEMRAFSYEELSWKKLKFF